MTFLRNALKTESTNSEIFSPNKKRYGQEQKGWFQGKSLRHKKTFFINKNFGEKLRQNKFYSNFTSILWKFQKHDFRIVEFSARTRIFCIWEETTFSAEIESRITRFCKLLQNTMFYDDENKILALPYTFIVWESNEVVIKSLKTSISGKF